jgi:dihydroflavonol-4-reductase
MDIFHRPDFSLLVSFFHIDRENQALREKYSDYPLPARVLPKTLMWLIGPYVAGMERRYVSNNIDIDLNLNNSKSKRDLGIEYKPLKTTMEDMFQQLIDVGAVKKA